MPHTISVKHALAGLKYCLKTQPNFRFHLFTTLLVLLSAAFLQLSLFEFTILIFTISFVLIAEMVNTSLESITDLITTDYKLQAKIAKDVSAGMVLLSAFMSIIVGLLIFVPHLIQFFP